MKKFEKGIKKINPYTGVEELRSEYSDEHQDDDNVTIMKDKDLEDLSDDLKAQLAGDGPNLKHKVDLQNNENEIVLESETDEESTQTKQKRIKLSKM